ncbi:RNA pyrophosphohydrolase [Acuticoccus sp. I52.16.1]|uniref:RNA pyrophosphohydrolase n=1 Tax=Acuticoccus sp. I52.16.1 TaxID=2928472 RepID=UPI001FCF99AF|nr:RNA pyrophosphohydrolase [Acuticoccus sp. I52.16.1]UOM34798.1 RNA pyrophosphohydrolase [Acuticoccus sp. I52.16.1]
MSLLAASPRKGYRLCVGIALFAADGQIFLGKRASRGVVPSYSWQMPQGGIDPGEAPLEAAHRELYEETSVRSVELIGEVDGWLHYDLPKDVASWRGRYKGQAQRWFAFRFLGQEGEINVTEPPDGHSVEFSRWKWESLAAVPSLVVPFKRDVYEHVVEAFAPLSGPQDLHPAQRRAI